MRIPSHEEVMRMSKQEANSLMKLCIGRVFRMLESPKQKNDSDIFEKCSMTTKSCAERLDFIDYCEKRNIQVYSKEIPYNHSISMYL